MSIAQDSQLFMPHRPGILLIHLLSRCNLACKYCYMDATPQGKDSLPFELVKRSIGEVNRLGIDKIWLTGGEPFLYPELPNVLETAAALEDLSVFISTGGTAIGREQVALLKDTGARVSVSIDGPEAYHDEVRGRRNTFKHASQGIAAAVSGGVLSGVVSVICKDNLSMLPWLVEWAAGMGVGSLTIQPLLQFGRASLIRDKKLTQEQLCDLALQLFDLAQTYEPKGLRIALAYRPRLFLAEHPCAAYVCNGEHCHRRVEKEIKKLVVREDGTVLPETPMLDRRFALGSLYEATLEELVSRYFSEGYRDFDRLCRSVYEEIMPTWTAPLIPWTEILSERSWTYEPVGCDACGDSRAVRVAFPPPLSTVDL